MERYTEYHCGVAVIKNKEMLKEAMAKLAAYEDAEEKGKHMNDGWVPVDERLPENAKHKGALCPRYQIMTKYGVTEGWYNPDFESWYILIWFMTERYLDSEIDFERGALPKIVRCENKANDRHSIVVAWRPLPEPYHPERSDNHD